MLPRRHPLSSTDAVTWGLCQCHAATGCTLHATLGCACHLVHLIKLFSHLLHLPTCATPELDKQQYGRHSLDLGPRDMVRCRPVWFVNACVKTMHNTACYLPLTLSPVGQVD